MTRPQDLVRINIANQLKEVGRDFQERNLNNLGSFHSVTVRCSQRKEKTEGVGFTSFPEISTSLLYVNRLYLSTIQRYFPILK